MPVTYWPLRRSDSGAGVGRYKTGYFPFRGHFQPANLGRIQATQYGILEHEFQNCALAFHQLAGRMAQETADRSAILRVEVKVVLLHHFQSEAAGLALAPPNDDAFFPGFRGQGEHAGGGLQQNTNFLANVLAGQKPAVQGRPGFFLQRLCQTKVFGHGVVTTQCGQKGEPGFFRSLKVGSQDTGAGLGRAGGTRGQGQQKNGQQEAERHGPYHERPTMKGQTILQSLAGLVFLVFTCGCSPATPGLALSTSQVDLGPIRGGGVEEVVFAFSVGEGGARVEELKPGCGCLSPRLTVRGRFMDLPCALLEGDEGEIQVGFATAGFRGRKDTTVEILGQGVGLPTQLNITSNLEPWFEVTPIRLLMGSFPATQGAVAEVVIRGPKPFRLLKVTGLRHLQLDGLPTPSEGQEHHLRVRVPPGLEPGSRTEYLRVESSLDMDLVIPVRFEPLGQLWLKPSNLLALGVFDPAQSPSATLEVGVTTGTLPQPQATLDGLPGARLETVTLEAERSYRLSLVLPADLPPGPVHGFIDLLLAPEGQDSAQSTQHRLRVVGISKPIVSRP